MKRTGGTPNECRAALARPALGSITSVMCAWALLLLNVSCALPKDAPDPISAPSKEQTTTGESAAKTQYATAAEVKAAVVAAQQTQIVPESVASRLTKYDAIHLAPEFQCKYVDNPAGAEKYGECAYGDPDAKKLMLVYGDSHADMWAATLIKIAIHAGWKLRVFAKHACPGPDMSFRNPDTRNPDEECDQFHSLAPAAVKSLKPDLVIVTSISDWLLADSTAPSPDQWREGWSRTLKNLNHGGTRLAFVGDLPSWPSNSSWCIAAHLRDLQTCSVPATNATPKKLAAEQEAAQAANASYIPTVPWICAEKCEPVIADIGVYSDITHLTQSYAEYLTGALYEALQPLLSQ